MKKLLIVIDMQNDFTYDALRNEQAIEIIPLIEKKLMEYDGEIVFTRDTHTEDYMNTQEGRKLPVPHCIRGTRGWEIVEPLKKICEEKKCRIFDKPTFGSVELMQAVTEMQAEISEIELIGVCTDICVISNAMLLKAAIPEMPIKIDSTCCAGVTVESHETALRAMSSCQIEVE